MTKHKHKPAMVMVISIGDKPKKKGETGVKKGKQHVEEESETSCNWVMNSGQRCGYPITANGLCEVHAKIVNEPPDSHW